MSVQLVVSFLVFAIGLALTLLEFREARTRKERLTRWLKVTTAVLGLIGMYMSWSLQQPREIPLATQETIVESLSAHAGETVSLHYVANDLEAYEFAQQLRQVLTRSGWNVRDGFRVSGPGSPAGLELRVLSEQPTTAALALANSLSDAGIKFLMFRSQVPSPGKAENEWLWIMVGSKDD